MQPTHWVSEGAGSPGPGAYCTPQQMKSYAQDLRNSRPARPTGSRPPPAHFKTWASRENPRGEGLPTVGSLQAAREGDMQTAAAPTPPPQQLHRRGTSNASLDQAESAGRALVQPPEPSQAPTAEHSLYAAARDEAADIVWKHRNPTAPENSPSAPYAYPGPGRQTLQRPKLQRTRSRSVGPQDDAEDLQRANSTLRKRHSIGSSAGGRSRSSSLHDPPAPDASPTPSPLFSTSPAKSAFDLRIEKASSDLPQQRKTSGSHRKPSGSLFQNPNDHIYEEPDDEAPPAPAPTPMAAEPPRPSPLPLGMRRNPFTRFQSVKGNAMVRSNTDPIVSMKRFDRYEIHRNEPTQSRNAAYTLNTTKSKLSEVAKADAENEEVKKKAGKEIRSDELRAATGFSLRDRSPKLPAPTMVSDAPGRPIVSFQKDYGVVELKEEKSILPPDPAPQPPRPAVAPKAATEPSLPTRKSVFERPTSRSGAAPSPFERPASRSASPFDRPASRSGAASPAPKESSLSSSPATLSSGPATPKGPFANRSPLSRVNTPSTTPAAPAVPPVPADPYALPSASAAPLPADPYALPTSSRPQPPVPSISASETRPASRSRFGRPQSVSSIPVIAVSETPAVAGGTGTARGRFGRTGAGAGGEIPAIAVSDDQPQRGRFNRVPGINVSETPSGKGRTGSIPSIGVTPSVPSIAVSDDSLRGRFNRVATTQAVPTIAVNETPSSHGRTGSIPTIAVSDDPSPRGRFTRVATTQAVPTIAVNEPPSMTRGHSFNAPVINLPTDVPTISVNEPSRPVPTINAPSIPSINIGDSTPTRPLPDPRNYKKPSAPPSRPSAQPSNPPTTARTHWTPTSVRTGAQCTHCALPISGRIVSAGGCRFHPECFACYQCGEKLECVAFYPEPSLKHAARVDRIRARATHTPLPPLPGWESADQIAALEAQDGTDESPRFYCHLDFHECFSPRCKSCQTPIEGEVVVACGAEWHPGHFFCAQCGDPFSAQMPFVEKEGYAWCVGCHANRFSAKCTGCRKPVVETVVRALGGEWHAGCFVCVECQGPFDDGRYFLRGENQPACVRCEERRLKA